MNDLLKRDRTNDHYWLVICGMTSLLLIGCTGTSNGNRDRVEISGAVTYRGVPVRYGVIALIPSPESNLPSSTLEIRDGRYQTDPQRGIFLGKYRVEITGHSVSLEELTSVDSPAEGDSSKQIIPEKYNTKSELELVLESKSRVQKDYNLN